MPNESHPPGGTETVLAARPSAGDDPSISWSREPADGADSDPGGEVDTSPVDRPGAGRSAGSAGSAASLWSDVGTQGFRDRWREVQLRFVDDPPAAVREAEALVTDATERLAAVIAAQRDDLAGWRSGAGGDPEELGDTEQLRVAIRRYREFLNRVLDL